MHPDSLPPRAHAWGDSAAAAASPAGAGAPSHAQPDADLTAQLEKYLKLDQKGSIMAEYVWVDAAGEVRSKSRVRFIPCDHHIASSRIALASRHKHLPLPAPLSAPAAPAASLVTARARTGWFLRSLTHKCTNSVVWWTASMARSGAG